MLSIRVRNWCVCSVWASVPDAYAQHAHQFLMRMLSMVCRDLFQIWNFYVYTEHTLKKLMRMLRVRVSSWLVCSANASVPDLYAQGTHQFLMRMLSIFWRECALPHQFLTRMLSVRISSWRACSMHTSVPDAHAQCTHQFLTRMLRVYKINIWKIGKLVRMRSMRVRNLCICSGCASVPDAHAQGAHQFLTRMRSVRIKVGACA
jgi:hypothetical protein